jgi:ABC-type dipeptide/oligopeptide/nickel transport system ATPase component/ABC-type dipeptide/oligopeptide/nickel transport system permease subunit
MSQFPTLDTVALQVSTPVRSHPVKRLLHNPLGVLALAVLALLVVVAVLAPWLAPFDPNYSNISKTLASPDSVNLLGTDSAGRDVFSRLVIGTQVTLLSALLCAAVAIFIGLPSGLIAGYYSGWFDSTANWVVNILMSLPGIIVLLTVRAAFGPSVWVSMIVFGIILSPGYFRLTRTSVQAVRNELYVDAARVSGLGDAKIIGRHIFAVVRAPIIIQTATVAGVAIAIQSGLEFLGLGDSSVTTWGVMLSEGFRNVYSDPLLLVWPAAAIGVAIGSLVLLGNAIRDALEDSEKVRRAKRRRGRPSVTQSTTAIDVNAEPMARVQPQPAGPNRVVTVQHLAVGYPQSDGTMKTVVEDVSFHVDRGEVLGIVGESGSGKSQTAFSILGLLPPEAQILSGSIQIEEDVTVPDGASTVDQSIVGALRGKKISYIPQEPMSNLDPAFTIGSQLVRPMKKVLGISKSEAKKRALDLLAAVGIPNPDRTFNAYPHELSGGMAQRVLIAGAISCEPDLIIADEPTTALDVTLQAEVLDLLRDLQHRLNVAIIVVTHNFGVVSDLCDRVVVMQTGQLVEEGAVRDILLNPQHPYTQALLGSMLQGKEPMTMLTSTASDPDLTWPPDAESYTPDNDVPDDDGPDAIFLEERI